MTYTARSDRSPSICFVAPSGVEVENQIARHVLSVATRLAQESWAVHILWSGAPDQSGQAICDGATCTRMANIKSAALLTLDGPNLFPALHTSDRVLNALRQLHRRHSFDLIEFPERGGLGFRAVQAKETGQAFEDVGLVVSLHGPSVVGRDHEQRWSSRPEELALDYAEHYPFAHADAQLVVRSDLLAEARRLGWMVRVDAEQVSDTKAEIGAVYRRLATVEREAPARDAQPLVTISVAYYNLGAFLKETLESLAQQTYRNLEVLVINDGSTDPHSIAVFEQMRSQFPNFRFLEQANAGIGATRNRGLREAQGRYFLPVDADNVALPGMVQQFVEGMEGNPALAALTCYFLAFRSSEDRAAARFAYAYKPTGGPRVLACLQNVYGDGNAIFRVEALRAVGGFEIDRDTSFEDWEAFVKLVNAGYRLDVVPDFLFHYRHRDEGFSRITNGYRNHQRVLRRFVEIDSLSAQDRQTLWNLLVGSQRRVQELGEHVERLRTNLRARRVARWLKGVVQRAWGVS